MTSIGVEPTVAVSRHMGEAGGGVSPASVKITSQGAYEVIWKQVDTP